MELRTTYIANNLLFFSRAELDIAVVRQIIDLTCKLRQTLSLGKLFEKRNHLYIILYILTFLT